MYLLKSNIGKGFDIGNKVIDEKRKIILDEKRKIILDSKTKYLRRFLFDLNKNR